MSSKHKVKHHLYCLNCHYPLAEFDKMCCQCGQKPTDGKTTMHDLLHEFIHKLFHLDGKFFWTLKHIFIPGKLTVEFFKGHHKRYAHPVQLFLVLGIFTFGLLTTVSKSKETEKTKFKTEESIFRKQVLVDLDSLKKTLPEYKINEGAKAIDSLLVKSYGKNEERENTTLILENWANGRTEMDSLTQKLNTYIKDSLNFAATKDGEKQKELLENLKKLRVHISDKKEDLKKDSIAAMKMIAKLNKLDIDFYDAVKYNVKLDDNDLEEIIADSKKSSNNSQKLFTPDSIRIGIFAFLNNNKLYTISSIDLYHYSEDELAEKYNIKGFWNKINFKQSIKFKKSGQEDVKTFAFSKLIWFTVLAILPMAAFYMLLYRRQKRFYVEHFVFLLHYTILIFALVILFLLIKMAHFDKLAANFGTLLNVYLFTFAMPIAMKNFYQQGWRKTILKFLIAGFAFIMVAILVILIAIAVTVAFF